METTEKPILSVTEISLSLKSCVEQIFSDIRVRGEVIGVKKAPSGHTYFSLKDSDSVLSAVCWRGRDKTTTDSLTDGLEIVCTGKLSTYPGRSNYQMKVYLRFPVKNKFRTYRILSVLLPVRPEQLFVISCID